VWLYEYVVPPKKQAQKVCGDRDMKNPRTIAATHVQEDIVNNAPSTSRGDITLDRWADQ
jgi:hypothetical protein